jgi:hypothetical protein
MHHNKAIKAATKRRGLGRANSARPLWQRYSASESLLLTQSRRSMFYKRRAETDEGSGCARY